MVLANELGGDYGVGMALMAGAGALVLALLAAFGPEAKGIQMSADDDGGFPRAGIRKLLGQGTQVR